MPGRAAAPAGVSSRPRSSRASRPMSAITTASRNAGASRNEKLGAFEVDAEVGGASAPATSAGRNGRSPAAAPGRCPGGCRAGASGGRVPSGRQTVEEGPLTIDDGPAPKPACTAVGPARPRALRGALRLAHKVMKSSAMRDLMAITERPEVISLAGGLPDTSTFPARVAGRADGQDGGRRRRPGAAVRPDRGHGGGQACIAEVMAAEGTGVDPDDILVTTGGQQVIDLVCKTLVDPGDVIVAEAPDLPRRRADVLRLPGRRRADRDGRRRHARSTSSRPRSTGSTPRAGGRSSSTRSRPSRTRPA